MHDSWIVLWDSQCNNPNYSSPLLLYSARGERSTIRNTLKFEMMEHLLYRKHGEHIHIVKNGIRLQQLYSRIGAEWLRAENSWPWNTPLLLFKRRGSDGGCNTGFCDYERRPSPFNVHGDDKRYIRPKSKHVSSFKQTFAEWRRGDGTKMPCMLLSLFKETGDGPSTKGYTKRKFEPLPQFNVGIAEWWSSVAGTELQWFCRRNGGNGMRERNSWHNEMQQFAFKGRGDRKNRRDNIGVQRWSFNVLTDHTKRERISGRSFYVNFLKWCGRSSWFKERIGLSVREESSAAAKNLPLFASLKGID